ncbi:DENN domain-containing protein 2A-like isoform X2 [Stegodyphus dumicola]|uniref:DENN domain-containing protein 2A-like isoform X2 n=1 Tax=Stegodyphus dumicola TaxID=202533 RepID=UPI0015B253A5|nr:DENN domain-containing protein 2A-like isoform X2 [Stegodyphus dumicola]
MNKRASVSSREGRTPPKENKVNIKEIRKKFESLSATNENNVSCDKSSTPVAPLRKNRSANSDTRKHLEKSKIPNYDARIPPENKYPEHNTTPSNRISVKERTKLFELSKETDCDNGMPKTPINSTDISLLLNLDSKCKTINSSGTNRLLNVASPPAKPPRSFNYEDKDKTPHVSENIVECVVAENNFVSDSAHFSKLRTEISKGTKLRQVSASFSFEPESTNSSLKNPRLLSAPEIHSAIGDKGQSTPKSQIISNKTQGFFNYFKNLSNTASSIREKVKQSKIFVDLTPTTVSPPKHYGTLKRSHSEEHIYAEPSAVYKSPSSKVPDDSNKEEKSLHYMCTPIVKPNVPDREKANGSNGKSVRNMIYESFSGLRTASKDSQGNQVVVPVTDASDADISAKAIQDRIIYVKSVRKQISSSSICISSKLYESLFIINFSNCQPEVSFYFPIKISETYNYPLLPHICFPDAEMQKSVSVYQSETFQFSLLDKDEKIFCYCLRIQGWPQNGLHKNPLCVKLPVAICILSSFNAPLFYKKLLTEIEKHLTLPKENCFKYITSLRKYGVPNAGASVSLPDYTESEESNRVIISRPLDSHVVGAELTRALQLLDVDILVKSVASLLLERRILLFSSSTSNLYQCCKAVSSLLYPFEWPHMIVPVLPNCLTVQCCSDSPYILGILTNSCSTVLELLSEHELLIIDVDKGSILKACNDEDTILPRKVQKAVITALNLAKNMTDPTKMLRDIMISEAFIHMFVELIGHYENHLVEQNEDILFQHVLKNALMITNGSSLKMKNYLISLVKQCEI